MKAKEMEKLMWKAGIEPNKFSHHFTRMNGSIPDGIEKLINLVEQATLERAAKVCDNASILLYNADAAIASRDLAEEIRALKTQGE